MNAFEKNLAVARGEAVAAQLLASLAIRTAISMVTNKEEVLNEMTAFIDKALNMSGPGKGDPNDELNTQVRETARVQGMQALDAIRQAIRNQPPAKG